MHLCHSLSECLVRRYNFAVRQQEVEQLKTLTLEQVNKFYNQCIPQSAKDRRRLAIHVVSSSHNEEAVEPSTGDLDALKHDLKLCALPVSPTFAK